MTMLREESEDDLKVLFGRAFLMQLERHDIQIAILFARAFLVRAMMNGTFGDNAS